MLLLLLIGLAAGHTITGSLTPPKPTRDRYQAQPALNAVKILLDGKVASYPNEHGYFQIFDVKDGVHFLEVSDMLFTYPIVLLEVSSSGISASDATPSALRHEKLPYPLKLSADKQINFYEKREPFSISSILFNPMVLILAATVFFTIISPKSLLDPEQVKEMKEMQKKMSKDAASNWLTSLMQPPA